MPKILVINSGSSSLKFAVIDLAEEEPAISGVAERLGTEEASVTIRRRGLEKESLPLRGGNHTDALKVVADALGPELHPAAIGHRIVHGGEEFRDATVIDDTVLERIAALSRLAPLHNPANAAGVRTARDLFPAVPQVAVFDTAFHQTLPRHAFLYGLPLDLYERHGVRRYGFHGTSHHYVALRAAKFLDRPISELQLLTAHLGNGCSACAIRNGRSVDTTMGLTPLEGVVMGTRSGDVDPNVHQFLAENTGRSLDEITNLLNRESGLLGLSGISNDLRSISEAADEGHERAALAIEVFCYRLAKGMLGIAAALGQLDGIVFTGGIGENSQRIRAKTLGHLKLLNANFDPVLNEAERRDERAISGNHASPVILVIPTNEERMIAQQTLIKISPTP